jgi:hypothetical protein
MSKQFRPSLRDRIYWSWFVQGAIDVAVVIVSLAILLVVEPARLVRRRFGATEDATGEPSTFREEPVVEPEPGPPAARPDAVRLEGVGAVVTDPFSTKGYAG